jgi:protein-S-isoprenylcysteine O-methyltransferase Ste14
VITLVIWPVLVVAYVWLARFEERMAIDQLGDGYREYMAHTKRFIPGIV